MENVTEIVIDQLNDFLTPNEHLKESVQVFKTEYYYLVYDDTRHVFATDSPTKLINYLFNNYKVVI